MIHLTPTENSWYPGERLSKKRSRNPLFLISTVVCLLFVGVLLALHFWLQVRTIITSRPIRTGNLQSIIGTSMLLMDEKKISDYIARIDPTVRRVTILKQFPQTIVITVIEDLAVAQIINGDKFLLIDSQGKILKTAGKKADLTVISYYQRLRAFESKPGTVLSQPEIGKALEIVQVKKQLPDKLRLIKIPQPKRITLTFVDLPLTVVLNTEKDIAKNVFILQNIIKGLDRKGVRPSVVNLEFDKPVITV